ncbi:RagB/SusD family nutrient uptake outer membrane protein [Reichenbachiella sp. MALMAid0571]|uniref:RagB/SusD family nutrient uptake outer membrane protein n=1 Tax=Reichenbachiella sp. MALMAid0571 TaxID=3143939 RepID=UPI0032DE744C
MMKNIYNNISIGVIMVLLLLSTGCNDDEFLTRFPQDSANPGNFFVNATSARNAVNAIYHPWQMGGHPDMVTRDMNIHLDAMTDDSYWRPARSSSIALEQWNITPVHRVVRKWWTYPFESVNAANFAIENIPNSSDPNFTPEMQAPYIAEAKFFRGFNYMFLTSLYGAVPLYTSAASDFSEFYSPRTSKEEIMAQVVKDFQDAKDDLNTTATIEGAPTKATAAAFLAKAYLVLEQWGDAETAARDAISIAESSGYALQDDYLSIWSEEGNSELLFHWSFIENDGFFGQNMTVQRLCRDIPPALRTDIYGDGWGYALPQRDLYDAFEDGDPRREFTLYSPEHDFEVYNGAEDFDYTHQRIDAAGDTITWDVTYTAGDMVEYDYRWSPTGLNVRKMISSVKGLAKVEWSGLDVPVMRLAELYLILAEALAEQGNAEALVWVNKVRSRTSVDMPDKTASDGDLVDLVRHERRVELAMEGVRLFDLIRWGTIGSTFNQVKRHFHSDFLDASSSSKFDTPIGNLALDPLFPVPQEEIDVNPEINTNNPGF